MINLGLAAVGILALIGAYRAYRFVRDFLSFDGHAAAHSYGPRDKLPMPD